MPKRVIPVDMQELKDILTESDGLWYRKANDDPRIDVIMDQWSILTERQKQVLTLVGLEGKTYEHTAAILGIDKSTVRDCINAARKKFRKVLKRTPQNPS